MKNKQLLKANEVYNIERQIKTIMPDYTKGKIYSIRSYQTDKIYIGSTIQPLSVRIGGHKGNYKKYLNDKYHYLTSFEIIKYDDCYIELIELFSCNSKEELLKKEGELIRSIECVNKCIAGRTPKEYYEEHKDENKQYREENKDRIKEYDKQYRESNKDEIAEKSKKYRETNKNKYICEICNYNTYCKTMYIKHNNTIKHKNNIEIEK